MTVSVVGLGFVGLTTALGLAEFGHTVYGMEADTERLSSICSGKLPFWEPGLGEALKRHLGRGFIPSVELYEAVNQSELIFYCVGTPYGPDGQADLTILFQALQQTLDVIKDNIFRVLVIKSTVPPSTTEKRIVPFAASWKKILSVANNPEFLREGHCWEDFIHADRIVLGVGDRASEERLRVLYTPSNVPIYAVSRSTAEYIKYLSNTVLACLISFANEMSLAADAIGGIDVAKAFRILHKDHRWQSGSIRSYFYPGCGYGGYCLPKDTSAFYALARSNGFEGQILKQTINLNNKMPEETARRIIQAAGENKNICIGILGLSFNAGSNDVRDTPSAKIIRALNQLGYKNILAYDPVAVGEFQVHYQFEYRCAESYEQVLECADLLAITTAWPHFKDVRMKTAKPVVDCRYML